MAFFSDKANVSVGVETRSNFNLSFHHVTTQEISRLQVVCKKEMVPGDNFEVSTQSFHRLAPLPVPTYGNIKNVTRAFFVPARILMNGFANVITQTTLQTPSGPVSPTIPKFTNDAFVGMFTIASYGLSETFTETDIKEDFRVINGSTTTKYRFTRKGKLWVNLFHTLGYRFNWVTTDKTEMSLLPLLAYLRIYLDWYTPTQYEPTDPLYPFLTATNTSLTLSSTFYNFCSTCLRFYEPIEKDFYTCAWPCPSGPVGLRPFGIQSVSNGVSTEDNGLTVSNTDPNGSINSYPSIGDSNYNGINSLTQYGLNLLSAVQNYVNRDMIAGNRYIEQMFARYGVKIPDAWLQRSEYLGSNSEPIQISDVMSTAATDDAQLGDYAGKGIGIAHQKFTYKAKEFGYFIVLNCLIAETGYVQGRDKENLHLLPLDFFTPEFDQLGAAPIRNDELFVGYQDQSAYAGGQSYGGRPDGVFGFSEQYYEYKNSRDYLTGDFAIESRNTGMNSYHLFRQISIPSAGFPMALNLSFMDGNPEARNNAFIRIFQNVSSYHDHFMSEHFVNVHANRPMHSSADSLVTEGGHEVEMSFNGYQL